MCLVQFLGVLCVEWEGSFIAFHFLVKAVWHAEGELVTP